MSSPAAVLVALQNTAAAAHRRTVVVLVALALALGALASPALTGSASAMSPRITASWAKSMLAQMNAERRAHHLRPLTMNTRLIRSAFYHNYRMAKRNSMSHQLPGEAFFATRIHNQGYNWSAAGENIGWSGRVSLAGVKAMQRSMYLEKAPNDGHRQNILSRSFTQVGIQVRYDARHHKVWFTQDFGRPMR